jgi:cobalt/nickel transport system permease protein
VAQHDSRVRLAIEPVLTQSEGVHIPDGFLDAKTCLGAYCLAGVGLTWAGRRVTAQWNDRTVPLLGVMSAFVFAAQMVNFPIAGGTSGHLLGGVLAAVLLGPSAAAMALTTVLLVQCFLFQDGGLTALGANVLNLSLIAVLGGYLIYSALAALLPGRRGIVVRAAVAAWASVVLAAVACALELAASGTVPLPLVLPAMTITHGAIGVGEALITAAVLSFVLKVRPDLFYDPSAAERQPLRLRALVGYGLGICLGLGLLLAPLASSLPDGLEKLAQQLAFARRAKAANPAPLADYTVPGVPWTWAATSLAALAGILLCFGFAWLIAKGLARRAKPRPASAEPGAPRGGQFQV